LTPRKDGDTDPAGCRFLFLESNVSLSRSDYFKDLLNDCIAAVENYPDYACPTLVAALIISDSINGLRKALLQGRPYLDKD
jgi:hypothetical protein